MTEFDIQKELFDHFVTLNDVSGIQYIKIDNTKEGYKKYTNVHFPNVPFTAPSNKRWFDLSVQVAEPEDAFIMEDSPYRQAGILRIDIYTPTDCGEEECLTKYRWIAKLFNDANLEDVDIMKVYISTKGNDADCYRLQIAVNWEAIINKE